MKYEYKIVSLNDCDDAVEKQYFENLQKWFDAGWEYVDTIQQRVSVGGGGTRYPVVGVVVRKEKLEL